MAKCNYCGEEESMPYTCRYCDKRYCKDHRLPEKHNCLGLSGATTLGPEFRNADSRDRSRSMPSPMTPPRGAGTPPEPKWEKPPPPRPSAPDEAKKTYFTRRSILKTIAVFGAGGLVALFATDPDRLSIPKFDQEVPEFGVLNQTNSNSTATQPVPGNSGDFDIATAEFATHKEINRVRREHQLATVRFDDELQRIAREHSRYMAERDVLSHTGVGGSSLSDRYERAGYSCRVEVSGNRYVTGGENVAQTWFRETIDTGVGTEYYSTAEELAIGLVGQWMRSPGHRENILKPYWNVEGIGIATARDGFKTKVYATQNFC